MKEHVFNNWKIIISITLSLSLFSCEKEAEEEIQLESTTENNLSVHSVELNINSLTASTQQAANPIENAIDNDSTTRWSGYGNAASLYFDFGHEVLIDYFTIAYYKGDQRKASLSYWTSNDGVSWQWRGSKTSSGTTTAAETFDIPNRTTRYFRIKCQGTTTSQWNSISEVKVYGTDSNSTTTSTCNASTPSGRSAATTSNTANLSWNSISNIDHYNVRYRIEGTSTWSYKYSIKTNSISLTGLSSGSDYEWQIRSKCADGSASAYNNAESYFSTSGTTTTNSSYPAGVLGIDSNTWKLNTFVGNPNSSPTYYDDINDYTSLETYSDNNYFYTDGEWVFLKCYRGLGGSANSDNSRVELREMDGSGDEIYWANEGTHSMEYKVRVDQLSNDVDNSEGVTCVGQIHGPGDSVDDVIRVQFYGTAGQSSGDVRIKISGYITEGVLGSSQFLSGTYQLDTEYTFRIEYNSDDYVRLYINGSQVFSQLMDTDEDENYFKVGNYIQESKGASYDGSTAIVAIKDLVISHSN